MEQNIWEIARNAFTVESDALNAAKAALQQEAFEQAVSLLVDADRIAASGCGHSGIACRHFAHLMCCIERPARFLSPSEAVHGAMGFLKKGDALLLASRGGETEELLPIMDVGRKKHVGIIAVTENLASPLAKGADVVLRMKVTKETDRYNSQGTTSFIVLSAIFDALQAAIIEKSGYQNEQFAVIHPAGAVGKRLNL